MSIQLFCSYMDAKSGSVRSSECAEALHEVAGGFAALLAGLFFFAWAGFELAVIAIFAKPFITAGRFISRLVGAEPESELSANQSRRLVGPTSRDCGSWRYAHW